jgi:hypothetical protein
VDKRRAEESNVWMRDDDADVAVAWMAFKSLKYNQK